MLEQMLIENITNKPLKYLVDISFDTLALGSKSIVDNGTAGLTYSTLGTGTGAGVIDDPDMGRCFYFDGTLAFQASNFASTIGKFANRKILIEVAFKRTTADTVQRTVFSTGDYQTYQAAGFTLSSSFGNAYIFMFLENGGSYAFYYLNGANTGAWEPLEITREINGVSTTIHNKRTGVLQTYAAFNTGGDSWFRVGGGEGSSHYHIGYLKYLRIADLNAQ